MTRTMPLGGDQAPEEMDAGDDSDDAADDGKDYLSENMPPKLQKAENSAQASEYAAKYRAEGGREAKAADGWFAPGIPSISAPKAGQLHDGDEGSAKATQTNMAVASRMTEDAAESDNMVDASAKGEDEDEDFLAKLRGGASVDDSVDAADDGEEMTRTMPLGGDQAPEEMDAGDDSDDAADDGKDYLSENMPPKLQKAANSAQAAEYAAKYRAE